MKTISLFLLLIPNFLFSQEVDEKYKKAASFIMDSVDLYSCFKNNFPTRKKKFKKIYYSGFIASSEIIRGDYERFRLKLHEKNIIEGDSLTETYRFKTGIFKIVELESLTINNKSVLVLFFARPYKNMLICEIFPSRSLITQRMCEDSIRFTNDKFKDCEENKTDISYDITYRYNTGLEYAFLFDKNNNIVYYSRRIIHFD